MLTAAQAQLGRFVDPFDAVIITGDMKVTLQPGSEEKVEIRAQGIKEDEVSVKVSKTTLRISVLKSLIIGKETIEVTITYKKLRSITAQAGALVEATSTLEGDKLYVDVSSGANAKFDVQVDALEVIASEGGMLTLYGSTDTQNVKVATGGKYEGYELEANHVYARANTGGKAQVTARQSIDASANTGGAITYRGNPEKREVRTFLSGEIESWK